MKKFSKLLAILLALMLVFAAFAACGDAKSEDDDDDEKTEQTEKDSKKDDKADKDDDDEDEDSDSIVGKWTADVDMTDVLLKQMDIDIELSQKFELTMTTEYGDDGEFEITFDEDQLKKAMESLLRDYLKVYLEDMAEQEGVTLEDLLAEEGYSSLDDAIDAVMENADLDSMMDTSELNHTGSYEVDGDKLYTWDEDSNKDEDSYIVFKLSGSKLEWKEAHGDSEDETFGELLPITFKRAK